MIELLQAMAAAYGNLWLWAWGGATGAFVWMTLTAAVVGTAMMAVPIVYGLNVVEQNRRAERFPEDYVKPPRWKIVLSFMAFPWFFISLFLTMGVGIGGADVYVENFRECVQIEDRTVEVPQTIMVKMCRDRNHVDEEWSEWAVANVQLGSKFLVPEVQELP